MEPHTTSDKGTLDIAAIAVVAFLLPVLVLVIVVAAAPAQPAWAQSAEISIVRHFQLQGMLLPAEGQYVSYSATVKNTGDDAITGMRLWVTFGSAADLESASFALPDLQPGQSRELSLGPFKMAKPGEHILHMGINRSGRASEPNDVALNYSPAAVADSITAYSTRLISAISVGAALAAAGGTLVALYLKKKNPK
ncbi:MAG: hypothetical protein ABI347_02705 [Nitrososphaera sp.]|jgi:hypothetical protein